MALATMASKSARDLGAAAAFCPTHGVAHTRSPKRSTVNTVLVHRYFPFRQIGNTGPIARLVVNVEIHQVPGKSEPDQRETREGDRDILKFGPEPKTLLAQTSHRVQAGQNGSQDANHAENSKNDDPRRKSIDAVGVIGIGQYG